jgi:branched-chain amino acid transport system ATP-binding protein
MSSVLEFKEATIRFGGLTAVAPLSFALPAGQLAAIIGPNGAGKTTVFNLITGVYAPTAGEIWLWGAAQIGNCPRHGNRAKIITAR